MKPVLLITFCSVFLCCWDGRGGQDKLRGYDYALFQDSELWDLAKAIKKNDLSKVDEIVTTQKPNLNLQEPTYGHTLLMLTIMNNQFVIFQYLLQHGADIEVHDRYNGQSAIIIAAEYFTGRKDVRYIEELLKYGADPNDKESVLYREGKHGRSTALTLACKESLEKVKILVEAGADVNYYDDNTPAPLESATLQDNFEIMLYLLEKGADYSHPILIRDGRNIYIQNILRQSMYPLNSSAYDGKMKVVDFLQGKGIDYRNTPIEEYFVQKAKKMYPKDWKEYLLKY